MSGLRNTNRLDTDTAALDSPGHSEEETPDERPACGKEAWKKTCIRRHWVGRDFRVSKRSNHTRVVQSARLPGKKQTRISSPTSVTCKVSLLASRVSPVVPFATASSRSHGVRLCPSLCHSLPPAPARTGHRAIFFLGHQKADLCGHLVPWCSRRTRTGAGSHEASVLRGQRNWGAQPPSATPVSARPRASMAVPAPLQTHVLSPNLSRSGSLETGENSTRRPSCCAEPAVTGPGVSVSAFKAPVWGTRA